MPKGGKKARLKFRKWLKSFEDVSAWFGKHGDLEQLLEEHGGLVKIDNFLPTFVAEGMLEMLQSIDEKTWNLTAAGDDYAHNDIRHQFLSVKRGPPGLEEVFRIFSLLLPDSLFTFSAAKYCKAGHIVPHDDRAYTQVMMDDGTVQLCSRNIACIYYLTKDWTAADGGQLVDLEAPEEPQQYLPSFNSLIAFSIPRWHEVKPVLGDRPRYSIFGWFLEPGKLYELNTEQQNAGGQQQEQQQQQQPTDQTGQQQHLRALKKKSKKQTHAFVQQQQQQQQQQPLMVQRKGSKQKPDQQQQHQQRQKKQQKLQNQLQQRQGLDKMAQRGMKRQQRPDGLKGLQAPKKRKKDN